MCLWIYLNLSLCLCIYLNWCLCLIAAIPQKLVRRHNTGLTNSNVYLNMTTSIFKENQVPSAHLRYLWQTMHSRKLQCTVLEYCLYYQ